MCVTFIYKLNIIDWFKKMQVSFVNIMQYSMYYIFLYILILRTNFRIYKLLRAFFTFDLNSSLFLIINQLNRNNQFNIR